MRKPVFMKKDRTKLSGPAWAANMAQVGQTILTPEQQEEGTIEKGGENMYIVAYYSGVSHGQTGGQDQIFKIVVHANPDIPLQAQYVGHKSSMPTEQAVIARFNQALAKVNADQPLPW